MGRYLPRKTSGLLVVEGSSPQEGPVQYHIRQGPQAPASGPCSATHVLYNLGQGAKISNMSCKLVTSLRYLRYECKRWWAPTDRCQSMGIQHLLANTKYKFPSSVRNNHRSKQKQLWLGTGLSIYLLLLPPSPLSEPILAQKKNLCCHVPVCDNPFTPYVSVCVHIYLSYDWL